MQIMPVTETEISNELALKDIHLSKENIRAGTYYFARLLDLFPDSKPEDRLRLALASYNAGPSRVYDAQELAAYLGENPCIWSSIQTVLPLLSKRYYSLHRAVWSEGKPPKGYFGSWRQTTAYVENIMKTYLSYLGSP